MEDWLLHTPIHRLKTHLARSEKMPTVAENRLKEICSQILQSSPKTLAHFRLSNPAIVKDLEDFAFSTSDEDEPRPLLHQVLELFQRLNMHMAEQERSCPSWRDFFVASRLHKKEPSYNDEYSSEITSPIEISVVFGGKFSKNPASISEQLVSDLVRRSQTVYTVSRSICDKEDLPSNVKHISKQNLDKSDGNATNDSIIGADEFYDVMSMAKKEWLETSSHQQLTFPSTTATLVFYYTLGQHKGVNPFVRNLNSAENFHRALTKMASSSPELSPLSSSESNRSNLMKRNWRVVVTGTDATLPSTHPPSKMAMDLVENNTDDAIVYTVPTYKIGTNNFVYAMSKLGQYYWIANAVAGVLMMQEDKKGNTQYGEIFNNTKQVFGKIKHHVTSAGEDGAYHSGGNEVSEETTGNKIGISMAELDSISLEMSSLMEGGLLQDHFQIAEQISICYTPLHAKPWTEDAIKKSSSVDDASPSSILSSQKAFILEQIVKRFKNAISIKSAASSHFAQEES